LYSRVGRCALNGNGQAISDFNTIVADHYSQLTKSEKRIANYMRKNQDECAFLSAGELAERLKLSEATMVRFARTLGFASYPALREALQDNIRQRVTHSARLRSRLDTLRETGDIFERLVASEIDYLGQVLQTVSRDAMDAAVELLHNHRRVFVFGLGPSISLVDLLEIRLTRSKRHVIPLKSSGQEMLEPMLTMTGDDLLIAIGFFNLTPNLQMVLDHAKQLQTPVILVTDTLGELLRDKADVVLAARRGPVSAFHSLTVPMTIINAMLLALSSVEQEGITTHLDKLDQLRAKFRKTKGIY